MKNDNGRLIAALVLSMLGIFAYNYFFVEPKIVTASQAQKAQAISTETGSIVYADGTEKTAPIPPDMVDNTAVKPKEVIEDRAKVIAGDFAAGKRVKIFAKRLHGSINLTGAVFDDLTLAKYRQTLEKDSPEVSLLSPRRTKDLYFFNAGWVATDGRTIVPNEQSEWKLESGSELTSESPITLSYEAGPVKYLKTVSVDDKQMLTIKLEVINNSAENISIAPFGLINRSWNLKNPEVYVSHEGLISAGDKIIKETDYSDLAEDGDEARPNVSGWIGIADKYWLTAMIPQNSSTDKFDIAFKYYKKDDLDRFQTDILAKPVEISAGQAASYTFNVYAGAKKLDYIEQYQKDLGIDLFDRSIDFGSLYFLTKPIFKALTFIHKQVGNMGLAILLLTVLIRLILFPLANKSYGSMARLKKHMPEVQKLREKYKNDKQKQGTEMMKYYRSHKINPAAGCLPMLVQIPVFFALYKVLYVTIEMRHEPFILFVKDLSSVDPTNVFTLFGLIAWNVPKWLPHIGILPILFSLTMFLQQKLNPPMTDETQRIVMAWMPWILLFLFAGFPAGLVIYWIWNNILSIIQQYIITRQVEEDKNA